MAVIPAGVPHSLEASAGEELEFMIFGTPQMAMDDERARPRKGVIVQTHRRVHFAVILRRFGLRAVAAFATFKRAVIASR